MGKATPGGLKTLFKLQRTIIALLFLSFFCGMVLGISLVTNTDLGTGILSLVRSEQQGPPGHASQTSPAPLKEDNLKLFDSNNHVTGTNKSNHPSDGERKPEHVGSHQGQKFPESSYNVHVFYYPWYGNPKTNGGWLHWNHIYLPHWDKREAVKWPSGRHQPPEDIGSSYYPQLGAYSSRDPAVIHDHMKQIKSAGIGTVAVSWYPPGLADDEGKPADALIRQLFDKAAEYDLKMCLHIEPYKNRSPLSLRRDIQHIVDQYGQHPAFYRHTYHGRKLPLYYVYDSYLTTPQQWAQVLRPDGSATVRRTPLDGVFIGLVVEEKHKRELISAGFDGFYTYFASDGFTHGSSTRNWPMLSSFALANDAIFIPSVGPGYVDSRVRPWNERNTKDREHGGYYEQSFKAALLSKPSVISITSFNEWHEGTQIERAMPKESRDYKYLDYSPHHSDYYLMLTRKWIDKFQRHQTD